MDVAEYGMLPATGFVRQKQLLQVVPFSAATLWRKVGKNEFPAPVKLSEGVTGWNVEAVRAWMAAKSGL